MEHIEMVERLHEKANISYTDAKDALERSGWDMLEALVLLEREGKIDPLTASTTSTDDGTSYEKV
ncbi:MAG: UBA/TS-N domain protein, partial [Clostridia bacterium]|nr:UBA/TS-N domain protein [Clostridia bacterium]